MFCYINQFFFVFFIDCYHFANFKLANTEVPFIKTYDKIFDKLLLHFPLAYIIDLFWLVDGSLKLNDTFK